MISVQSLFQDAGRRYPSLSKRHVRVLLAHHLGQSIEFLLAHPETSVSSKEQALFWEQVAQLAQGMPLSRLLGKREFWGMEFELSSETLDPRPDSETLIEAVLQTQPDRAKNLRILDLGTGTGCLIISLLKEYPEAQGVAVDQSEDALATARKNAHTHAVENRLTFHRGDWFSEIQGRFDVIISNPPYISADDYEALDLNVKNHDPKKALVAGGEGLDCYEEIIPQAPDFLKEGGVLVLEIGYGQGEKVQQLMAGADFSHISVYCDLAGIERCLVGFLQTIKAKNG
jgi:release factor glutamine methyltransferase